jgi:hypothetical protein
MFFAPKYPSKRVLLAACEKKHMMNVTFFIHNYNALDSLQKENDE